jgi:RNA polymerase nonessential primary-like sigma factor
MDSSTEPQQLGVSANKKKLHPKKDSFTYYLCEIGRYRLLTRDEENLYGRQIQAMMAYEERRRKLNIPLEDYITLEELDPEEVAVTYETGLEAKEIMINSNLRLVVSIAKKYNNVNLNIYDLVQEGNTGLIKGIEKYNPVYGVKLSTYVSYWIKEAINKGISKTGRLIRLPVHVTDKLRLIRKINKQYLAERGRPATMAEVCLETGLTSDYIRTITNYLKRPASLNMTVEGMSGSLLEFIEYVPDDSIDLEVDIVRDNVDTILVDLLSCLNDRDKEIVMRLNGVGGYKRQTCEEVSKCYGLCAGRVKQIEREAIKKLRDEFTAVPEVTERIISCLK